MFWTQTFIPTLRDDPQEAEIPSHKLMLRAGLIRRLSGGLYTFLPLGLRALRKVEQIVREEMDRAGALEILMPALQPRELWEQTGRYGVMGPVMFRIKDRQERDMVLGPTHEEVVTDLATREFNSWRHLPRTLYQIQTKFRDEIRPRFGLMRAKEFIMKDAYSFDTDWAAADRSYQAMYDAYVRVFARCGLRTRPVEADTGAMGGQSSHEFMVIADAGEDGIVECPACGYAANMEKAERFVPPHEGVSGASPATEAVPTPGARTIEQVAAFLKCEARQLIKTLIYVAEGKPIAVLVPGDRELNEHKLAALLKAANLALADNPTIERVTGAPVGFAGPVGLNIPVYADLSLRNRTGCIAGGNRDETHLRNVDMTRDVTVAGFHDLVIARSGDLCPKCHQPLVEKRGIEVGHVFKLGTKYTDALDTGYLNEKGERQRVIMGCYGIGVTRTLQAVIEQSHDAQGIVWPLSVAPYRVLIVLMNPADAPAREWALRAREELGRRGIDALIDDRDERPGVKFKDADLVGFPIRVIAGGKAMAAGKAEVKLRAEPQPRQLELATAIDEIAALAAHLPGTA